jgi:hypothetical protein
MGVVIDSGFGLDAEAVHDDFGASPLQDGFLDLLAKIVAADFAAEAVVLELRGKSRFGWKVRPFEGGLACVCCVLWGPQ